MEPLQVWGGVECTVNRVGDAYFNQLDRSGHRGRLEDLDRIAELGIRTLRYPLLWELNAPDPHAGSDWKWASERLDRLRELRIEPIVGLVHHGSGPPYTCLTDDRFASGLAAYAGSVAARFPWVEWYTPVNEPLTTARFSGLYGLWHPHARSDHAFARSLVNQCRGTILSMQAIRRINPNARLLQTDDVGTTQSTPRMQYQANFDNERRWLGWDLICGRVGREHPMRDYLLASGLSARELDWFCEFACPPDVIGINHYVTSDRFLDERLERYPCEYWGANRQERYVDVEAVRVVQPPQASWENALRSAWGRYHIPLALTEVHLGCTREEQLRWFISAWNAAQGARGDKIEVIGVTAWALFGSFNWDSLLTRDDGYYESGVFDVRGHEPRPTALANLIRELIHGHSPHSPILDHAGWWQRNQRLRFLPQRPPDAPTKAPHNRMNQQPLLVWSAGPVAAAFSRICEERGLAHKVCSSALPLSDAESMGAEIERVKPWAIVYAENADPSAPRESEACPLPISGRGRELASESARRGLPYLIVCLGMTGNTSLPAESPGPCRCRHESATPIQNLAALIHRTLDLLIDQHSGAWCRSRVDPAYSLRYRA
jgi:dTDP-4-dehydrorhamnose reductase